MRSNDAQAEACNPMAYMQAVSCGRPVSIKWDAELQSWEVSVDGIEVLSHCSHWSSIDNHVATVIEAYGRIPHAG